MLRVSATELSNPVLAPWTTAFIRSVIGECLHNISQKNKNKKTNKNKKKQQTNNRW